MAKILHMPKLKPPPEDMPENARRWVSLADKLLETVRAEQEAIKEEIRSSVENYQRGPRSKSSGLAR